MYLYINAETPGLQDGVLYKSDVENSCNREKSRNYPSFWLTVVLICVMIIMLGGENAVFFAENNYEVEI